MAKRKPLVSIEKGETEKGFSRHVLHERLSKHFHDFHHRMRFYFERLSKNQAYHDRYNYLIRDYSEKTFKFMKYIGKPNKI